MIDPEFDPPAKAGLGADPFEATSCLAWGILAIFVCVVPGLGQIPGTTQTNIARMPQAKHDVASNRVGPEPGLRRRVELGVEREAPPSCGRRARPSLGPAAGPGTDGGNPGRV